MGVTSAKELIVYQKAFDLADQVFHLTLKFPWNEVYSLTSQIRRSSRSVCLNLREAWAKRRYPAHFISKLTDCDGEINETDTALDFARKCYYLTDTEHATLAVLYCEIGKMLGAMIRNPDPFLLS